MLGTDLYGVFIALEGQRALVVGDGDMAREKAEALIRGGAEVTIVAPDAYEKEALEGCLLVVAAVTDMDLAHRINADATARAMLVNVADVPDLCNFILPALARSGPITVAVSTSGASPALAQRIRHEVADAIDEAYGELAEILDTLRPWAKENLPTYEARRDFFAGIVGADPDPVALIRAGSRDELNGLIEAAKDRWGASGSAG